LSPLYLIWIVWDGLRLTKRSQELEGYFPRRPQPAVVGCRAVGDGHSVERDHDDRHDRTGYADGMRFLQFYFALPIAMILLSIDAGAVLPQRQGLHAYEYLERRFDAKTRAFTSLLFLLSRSMSLGVVISAPAVVCLSCLALT
jgi:uncharacterized sodium:solute symporter family permease YidK